MAKDLGNIEIIVKAEKPSPSTQQPLQGAGGDKGATAGLGDVIRGVSQGGLLGGLKAGGLLKFATGIGIAAIAVAAFVGVISKIVKTIAKWSGEITEMVLKFSTLNARLAATAAHLRVRTLLRDIGSAGRLSGLLSVTAERGESITDLFQPVKDLFTVIKALVVGLLQPIIHMFVIGLRNATESIAEFMIMLALIAPAIIDMIAAIIKPIAGLFGVGAEIDFIVAAVKAGIVPVLNEGNAALFAILTELKTANHDAAATQINKYFENIGSGLTGGRFNP